MPIGNTNNELENNQASLPQQIATESARIAMVGAGVAGVLAVPDVLMHMAHTNQSSRGLGLISAAIITTAGKAAIKGYPSSATTSTLKNGTLVQRTKLEELTEGREPVEHEQTINEKNSQKNSLFISVMIAASLGVTDTTLTQFHTNKKTWLYQAELNPTFKVPKPSTFAEYFKAFKVGYNTRALKNTTNVAGYIMTPKLKDMLTGKLPEFKYVDTTGLSAAIFSGITIGTLSNVFDIIYKKQTVQVTQNSFITPTAFNVMNKLIAEESPKALRRGLAGSILYTSTAYLVVPKIEKLVDNVLSYFENTSTQSRHSFFSPKHFLEDAVKRQEEEKNNPFLSICKD
ncbi:MAG: hypothetical protein P4M12_10435 [Gammaproteobacteria bacterium]|nr:hypothetical protein [Gammaproteobacteria bacterium]